MFCLLLQKEQLEKSEKEKQTMKQELQNDLAKAKEANKREQHHMKEMKEHVSLVCGVTCDVRKEVL